MGNLKRTGVSRKGEISLQNILNLVRDKPELKRGGAIVTFTGIVRGYTHEGKEVQKLEVEAHLEEANKALAKISEALCTKPGVVDVIIYHLTGEFYVGEDLVYVVVVGKSRKDAFQALEEAVERYKTEATIWKKEYLRDGTSRWIS